MTSENHIKYSTNHWKLARILAVGTLLGHRLFRLQDASHTLRQYCVTPFLQCPGHLVQSKSDELDILIATYSVLPTFVAWMKEFHASPNQYVSTHQYQIARKKLTLSAA